MRKTFIKFMVSFIAVMVLFGAVTISASASTIRLKNGSFTTDVYTAKKKAKTIKKGQKLVIIPSRGTGYLRFKVTKTKVWTFKLWKLTTKSSYSCGYFYVMRKFGQNDEYIGQSKMSTKGGKSTALWIATEKTIYGKTVDSFLTSRSGKIKLKKGEIVYLFFSFSGGDRIYLSIK